MLLIISPSKTQNFSPQKLAPHSTPTLLEQACQLVKHLQALDVAQIGDLLKTSAKLSQSSWQSFQNFQVPFTDKNAKQAILAFEGDVFRGIRTEQYSEKNLQFAQKHLRILSGLYGILKPLDLIQPYRLEMSTSLLTNRGENLYSFWRPLLSAEVNKAIVSCSDATIVNLASLEYFKALIPSQLKGRLVNIAFKEKKNGTYRTIAIHSKRARGKMVNFVITNRLTQVTDLASFSEDDYQFNEELSSSSTMTFCRG